MSHVPGQHNEFVAWLKTNFPSLVQGPQSHTVKLKVGSGRGCPVISSYYFDRRYKTWNPFDSGEEKKILSMLPWKWIKLQTKRIRRWCNDELDESRSRNRLEGQRKWAFCLWWVFLVDRYFLVDPKRLLKYRKLVPGTFYRECSNWSNQRAYTRNLWAVDTTVWPLSVERQSLCWYSQPERWKTDRKATDQQFPRLSLLPLKLCRWRKPNTNDWINWDKSSTTIEWHFHIIDAFAIASVHSAASHFLPVPVLMVKKRVEVQLVWPIRAVPNGDDRCR